jgi:hypothetical protein
LGALGALTLLGASWPLAGAQSGPTPEEYVATSAATRSSCRRGSWCSTGRKLVCGHRPTVIDNNLDDYGAAYPGFLILNKKLLGRFPCPSSSGSTPRMRPPVPRAGRGAGRLLRGAARRGQEVADARGSGGGVPFISPAKGDSMHFSGSHRCEAMRQCYADPTRR